MNERRKWNERYQTPGYRHGTEPPPLLLEVAPLLPEGGTAIDLACGEGQAAVYLASRGLSTVGLDISDVALEKGRRLAEEKGVEVHFEQADLSTHELPHEAFDVIHCAHYLCRDLVPRIRQALRPGGTVVMEMLVTGRHPGHEIPPRYLVDRNEVLRWFIDFWVLFYREGWGEARGVAQIAARKPLPASAGRGSEG